MQWKSKVSESSVPIKIEPTTVFTVFPVFTVITDWSKLVRVDSVDSDWFRITAVDSGCRIIL